MTTPRPWYRKIWLSFLNRFLPNRIKRMMFLSTFYAYISNVSAPSSDMTRKLNEVLRLASDENALKFPIMIKSTIWRNLDEPIELEGVVVPHFYSVFKRDIFFNQKDKIIDALMERTPSWLIYGPRQMVMADMTKMMERLV